LGVNFTYLDHITYLKNVGDKFVVPSRWKTYTKSEVLGLILALILVFAIIIYNIYLMVISGLIVIYGCIFGCLLLFLVIIGILIRKNHDLHLHHYFLFGILIPFTRFLNPISSISQGILSGIFIEGIARWKMAKLWQKKRNIKFLK